MGGGWKEAVKGPQGYMELLGPVCSFPVLSETYSKVFMEAIKFTNLPLVLLNKKNSTWSWAVLSRVFGLQSRGSVNSMNGSVLRLGETDTGKLPDVWAEPCRWKLLKFWERKMGLLRQNGVLSCARGWNWRWVSCLVLMQSHKEEGQDGQEQECSQAC